MGWLRDEEIEILQTIRQLFLIAKSNSQCCSDVKKELKVVNMKLDKILQILAPPVAVGFKVAVEVQNPK